MEMATRKAACLEAKPCVLGRLRRRKSLPLGGGGGPSGIRKQDAIYERHLVRTQRNESAVAVTSKASEAPSIYFEPFVRSFILGAAAGAAFEVIHVASKFVNLLGEVGYGDLGHVLPSMRDRFAPLFVNDHIVALGCWFLLYITEAYAILKVLERHTQDPTEIKYALESINPLPKKMLPSLKPIIKAFGFDGALAAPTSVQEASRSSIVAPPPQPQKSIKPLPQFLDPLSDPRQEPEGPSSGGNLQEKRAAANLRPGQLDAVTQGLLRRQKELTSRRCFLRNFWYAAGISEQIRRKPVAVEILGEKLVLYRSIDGTLNCLRDVCPHRGSPLSTGRIIHVNGHECIECGYHGWAFDKDGVARYIPSADKDNITRSSMIQSYPVAEKGGFVWLFYGSKDLPAEERPPIPHVPELEDPKWRPVYGEIEFECSHWGVFENAIDMAHIHYLHNDSFGNAEHPEIKSMTCTTDAYGVNASFALHNKPVNALWDFSKVPEVKVTAKALLPSTSVIGFSLGRGLSFITFVNTVPISATRSINRFALIRRLDVDKIGSYVFNMPAWDSLARDAMIKILKQDKEMVESLMPEMLGREVSVKADMPQTAFRKLRSEYIALGYGVDPQSNTFNSQLLDM